MSSWRKSTYSGGMSNNCVEVATADATLVPDWRKSTFSGGMSNQCVEVATADAVLVRDTTNRAGVTLTLTAPAWTTFLTTLR